MSYPKGSPITYTAVPATPGFTAGDHTVQWAFDDATTASGATTQKTWNVTGNRVATATATNVITGATATDSKTISVAEFNLIPAPGSGPPGISKPMCAVLQDGKVLSVGGLISSVATKQCWEYDGVNWVRVGDMAYARSNIGASGPKFLPTLNDGRVLVAANGHSSGEVYNPTLKTWSATGALARTTDGIMSFCKLLDGNVYCPDGRNGGTGTGGGQLLDASNLTWSQKTGTGFTSESENTPVLLPDGRVFYCVYNSTRYKSYIWNPTNNVTTSYNTGTTDTQMTCALGSDGYVYTLTGSSSAGWFKKFDPGTNAYVANPPQPTDASWSNGAALVAAAGGRYLVAFSPRLSSVSGTNVFDVVTQTWLGHRSTAYTAFIGQPGFTGYAVLQTGRILAWGSSGQAGAHYIFDI